MADELCVLTSVTDATLAHILKGLLEANDIPVVLRGGGVASGVVLGGMRGELGIEVQVLKRDLWRAREVLVDAETPPAADQAD